MVNPDTSECVELDLPVVNLRSGRCLCCGADLVEKWTLSEPGKQLFGHKAM